MPRHTWNIRVELCETHDAVFAHAYLDNGPIQLSGRGRASVGGITEATHARGVAACRALADLSQVMLAAEQPATGGPRQEALPSPAHVRDIPVPEPSHSIFVTAPGSLVVSSAAE